MPPGTVDAAAAWPGCGEAVLDPVAAAGGVASVMGRPGVAGEAATGVVGGVLGASPGGRGVTTGRPALSKCRSTSVVKYVIAVLPRRPPRLLPPMGLIIVRAATLPGSGDGGPCGTRSGGSGPPSARPGVGAGGGGGGARPGGRGDL